MGMIRPIDIDTHQIGNVTTSYNYYLSGLLLPGILEMIVILVLIYSLGAELKFGTSRHLMETSGHSIVNAISGKLLVWTGVFAVLGFILVMLLYHQLHFPMNGKIFNMFIPMLLLVLASEAIAIFIIELVPVPRLALSIGALYSVLGFSLAGFTLPLEAMPPYIQGLAAIFPLTLLSLLCPGSDLRCRIRRMVERSHLPDALPVHSAGRPDPPQECLHPPELS